MTASDRMKTEGNEGVGVRCACGRPATANGRECSEHFRARLLSVRVDKSNFDTAERDSTYYDRESVSAVFGEDARERMLEETDGLGYAKTDRDDTIYHRDRHSGEAVALTDKQLEDVYLPSEPT